MKKGAGPRGQVPRRNWFAGWLGDVCSDLILAAARTVDALQRLPLPPDRSGSHEQAMGGVFKVNARGEIAAAGSAEPWRAQPSRRQ